MALEEITELARRLGGPGTAGPTERRELVEELRLLSKLLRRAKSEALARRLDSGATLLEDVKELSPLTADEVQEVVFRLVASVERSLSGGSLGATKTPPGGKPPLALSELMEPEPESQVRLGQVLKNLGIVTDEDIDRAVALQRAENIKIGAALVRLGAATTKQIQKGLEVQNRLRYGTPMKGATRGARAAEQEAPPQRPGELRLASDVPFGELLIRLGYATPAQVASALTVQRATGLRIGETMVNMGILTWTQVKQVLHMQSQWRNAAKRRR